MNWKLIGVISVVVSGQFAPLAKKLVGARAPA